MVQPLTQRYPNNPRSEWVTRPTALLRLEGGLYRFAYDVWPTQKSLDANDPPFVKHGHIAQIRANHQRIRTDLQGRLYHFSGAIVAPDEVEDFLERDDRAYHWVKGDLRGFEGAPNLLTLQPGRSLPAFVFPTYWGVDEALDPQWQRDRFTVPLDLQVQELIQQQLLSDEQHKWTGDRSHTTWDLQVGASADDANQVTDDSVSITFALPLIDASTEHFGARFVATIPADAVVDLVQYALHLYNSNLDEPQHQLRGQAAAAPTAFTIDPNNIDARPRTTASHQWNSANLGATSGSWWEWGASVTGEGNGANVGSIIQENVDAFGELTALVFIFEQHTEDALRDLGFDTYNSNTTLAPKLHIEATAGGGAARRIFVVS